MLHWMVFDQMCVEKNVETQTPSQIKHHNTDDEDQCFEDTFDRSMELSFCEAVKIDANLQYEKEKTYKCSISNTVRCYILCLSQFWIIGSSLMKYQSFKITMSLLKMVISHSVNWDISWQMSLMDNTSRIQVKKFGKNLQSNWCIHGVGSYIGNIFWNFSQIDVFMVLVLTLAVYV